MTGPSGAGKTTAARILASLGCAVIDGDALAREIAQPGSPVLARLAERFGEDICKGGILDRPLLAARAFASEKARRDLNSITHPAIAALAVESAKALQGRRAVVLDAAALLESELAALCAHILVVTAPEGLRLRRILARGGVTEQEARRRVEAQRRMDFRAGAGRTVIQNEGSEEDLRHAVEKAFYAVAGGGAACGGAAGASFPPEG
ncbi:MAG: dephospho-CoA kinase [Oscillospiraceae bacterium]|nr:dephospho-CoA kinase [Oscillospiraceae bacterium]